MHLICFIQSSPSRMQTYGRKFNPAVYSKLRGLSGHAEKKAVLGILIYHIIIVVPAEPYQSLTSCH